MTTICTEAVALERLEFLDVTDEALADSLQRCPVNPVKKTYSRLSLFPRLLTLTGGVCHPTHSFTENQNTLAGYFDFDASVVQGHLAQLNSWSGWAYVLLVTRGDAQNWLGGVKISSAEIVEGVGIGPVGRLTVQTLYRRTEAGSWVVSETPFEGEA